MISFDSNTDVFTCACTEGERREEWDPGSVSKFFCEKMGINHSTTSLVGLLWRLNETMHVKYCDIINIGLGFLLL